MIRRCRFRRIAAEGNIADEDYFLFTVGTTTSGFLTVNANDDTTVGQTTRMRTPGGTLFGPMETGPDGGKAGRADCDRRE